MGLFISYLFSIGFFSFSNLSNPICFYFTNWVALYFYDFWVLIMIICEYFDLGLCYFCFNLRVVDLDRVDYWT